MSSTHTIYADFGATCIMEVDGWISQIVFKPKNMKHIIPISGKDSLATALVQKQIAPDLDYEYIFNPTGKELPETIEWIRRVEAYLGKEIVFVGQDMRLTNEWQSGFRPSINARYCTRLCKIQPTEKYFGEDAFIYYGLRADEPERIGYIAKGKSLITAKYPLREQGINISGVLEMVNKVGLKPPTFFWQELYDWIKIRVPPILFEKMPEWERDYVFSWRKRNNCYDCFFMARIEWVGLAEFHPDIFWAHVEEEEKLSTREKPFYTIQNYPLRKLYRNRWKILNIHAEKVAKQIYSKYTKKLFDDIDLTEDLIGGTSCGLLCGK